MDPVALPFVVACEASAILGALLYFRRARIDVPPIGVFGVDDALTVGVFVAVMPFVYLALPSWLVQSLFALGGASLLQLTFAALLRRRTAWRLAAVLTAMDGGLLVWLGSRDSAFLVLNDCLVIAIAIGLANLWAQSGMRVRDAVVLGGIIAAFDYLATLKAPLMVDVMDRLAGVAFAPRLAFNAHGTTILCIGLGDTLFASVFPLLLWRAYGRFAAIVSAAMALAALAAMAALVDAGVAPVLPAMVVIWPLMLVQHACLRRRGPERTTCAYIAAEPRLLDREGREGQGFSRIELRRTRA